MYTLRSDDRRYMFDTDNEQTEITYDTHEQAAAELEKLEQFIPKGIFKVVEIS